MEYANVIVLTIYGKEKNISHISASLFDSKKSAENYCDNINRFSLQNEQWVFAKIVDENEKFEPFPPECMDMKFLDTIEDRSLQWLILNINNTKWAIVLKDADEATKERVFKNMTKRRARELKEEIEFSVPPSFLEQERTYREIVHFYHRWN